MRAKGARSPYALSANVNSAIANERVLIVNLRFIEEAKKAREGALVRITEAWCSQLSPLSYVNTFVRSYRPV